MAKVLFSNNAVTSLASYISSTSTTMTLAIGTGALFPEIKEGSGDYFYVTVLDTSGSFEIVKVTARAADLCTIVRAQENTQALNFPQGSTVEQRVTAASLNDIVDTLTANIRAIPSSIYPVGSIYMSMNATDPSVLFGGSWDKLEDGRVLIGANDTYSVGSTGGSFTHTLTTDELPAHSHSGSTASAGEHSHSKGTMRITGWAWGNSECFQTGGSGALKTVKKTGTRNRDSDYDARVTAIELDTNFGGWSGNTSSASAHSHSVSVGDTGGSRAHSIMQPYLAVHMWKRVA